MEQTSDAKKRACWFTNNFTLIIVFLFVVLLLLAGLYSQTQVTLRESRARAFEQISSEFTASAIYNLTVTYPKFLLLESDGKARAPMIVHLTPIIPVSTPIPVTQQPVFILTLSSTSEVVEFTDEKGVPLALPVVLTPTLSSPAVIYLHQSTSVTRPHTAKISMQVADTAGNRISLSSPLNLEIALESGEELFIARLCELVGTTSIFISLVTTLLGVGWKWWEQEQRDREKREQEAKEQERKAQEQRERERKEQEQKERELQEQERQEQERKRDAIERALSKVESLQAVLGSNLSEAARCYLEYTQETDFPWQESDIKNRLQTVWSLNAPRQLQNLITLWHAFPEKWTEALAQIGSEAAIQSLVWAWRMLDEDWQKRLRLMLAETVEEEIKARSWQAILKPWRQVCFWKPNCFHTPPNLAKALELLELQRNPFGSERAEQDDLLFETWVDLEWSLQTPQPQIIVGKRGAGKTALALYTIRNSIEHKTAFPIYVPNFPNQATQPAQLDNIARTIARTLLHFLAFYPRSFLEQDVTGRSAIAQLLGVYIGVGKDLALQLQKAGLESIAEGRRVFQELERLLSHTSMARPPDDELITLLGAARPSGFSYTIILADLPDVSQTSTPTWGDTARILFNLLSSFYGEPVYLKMLLPDELVTLAPSEPMRLEWSEERLRTLLQKRLGVVEVKSLNAWCNPEAAQSDPDQSLIQAARGLPGRLIHLGNALLTQLASHPDYPKITAQDLDKVLGNL